MKSIYKLALLVLLLTFCNGVIIAQDRAKERLTREQLAEAQAKTIAKKLMMSQAVSKQFSDLQLQYQNEIWALGPRLKQQNSAQESMSNEQQSQQEIQKRFERSQQILDIRHKYYLEYSKFLSQEDIKRIYKLEREIMEHLSKSKRNIR